MNVASDFSLGTDPSQIPTAEVLLRPVTTRQDRSNNEVMDCC
jgi:hypothetical protein